MKEIITYLNFDGNCRDAMKFYQRCFGGELQMVPLSKTQEGHPLEAKDRIMHARLVNGSSVLMASDMMHGMPFHQGNNVSVCVNCGSSEEIETYFAGVSEGGTVTMPLQDTFWGARFGMVTDHFGIHWMFNFEQAKA